MWATDRESVESPPQYTHALGIAIFKSSTEMLSNQSSENITQLGSPLRAHGLAVVDLVVT